MTLHEKLQNERAEGVAEGRKQGIEQGIEKGTSKEKIATVKRLEEMELSIEQIAKGSGLTVEEVQKMLSTIVKSQKNSQITSGSFFGEFIKFFNKKGCLQRLLSIHFLLLFHRRQLSQILRQFNHLLKANPRKKRFFLFV